MNYLLKSSNFEDRRKMARRKILVTVLILVIGFFIINTHLTRQILFYIAEPIWKIQSRISNSSFGEYFRTKQNIINEKIALEQKLFLAGDLMAQNSVLQKENDTLKDLFDRKETKLKTILASILVKPPQTPYDTLTVDVGEDQQIKIGDKVIALANVFIGEVTEVYSHSSKVTLYSTPGQKLSVVLGDSSISAEAEGIGGGNFNIFLPKEVEVKENDVIVIPAITSNVFGIVEKVTFKDKDSFQTVLFKSPVNIAELTFVEIVLNK